MTVRFSDGSATQADLLIGADGLHSVIRQQLFPSIAVRYSGQTCFRGIASFTLPPQLARTCQEWWSGEYRFGFSAIDAQHVYWFAPMLAPTGRPETFAELRLENRYAAFPALVPALLRHTPPTEIIRTDLYELPSLPYWRQGRVVLLGDAAHAMTPNLGQGGAQAIEDAVVLSIFWLRCPYLRHWRRMSGYASHAWRALPKLRACSARSRISVPSAANGSGTE